MQSVFYTVRNVGEAALSVKHMVCSVLTISVSVQIRTQST